MDAYESGFMGAGERAWHNKGIVIPEDTISIERAFQLVPELASDVVTRPLRYLGADGDYHDLVGNVANVRLLDEKVVGVVSDDHTIIHPTRACRFLDDLLAAGELRCHTAGTVKGGRQWWMLFRLPADLLIGGYAAEAVKPFMLVTGSYDGSMSLTFASTPVRVVCWNTIRAGLAQAASSWSTNHRGELDGKLVEAGKALALIHTYYDTWTLMAERLAESDYSEGRLRAMLDKLSIFTVPADDTDRRKQRRAASKDAIVDYYTSAPNLKATPISGTKYAAWNAVVEWSDWDRTARKTKLGDTAEMNRFARIMGNEPVKDEALSLLLAS